MRRVVAFFVLLLLFQTSCQDGAPPAIQLLDLKGFRVEVPAEWRNIPGVGYDSQVGQLTNGKDVVQYDYGWYSYTLRNETSATHLRTVTTINGRPALIVRPKKRGNGVIGLYVEVDAYNRLSLTGRDIGDETTILRIFESVRF